MIINFVLELVLIRQILGNDKSLSVDIRTTFISNMKTPSRNKCPHQSSNYLWPVLLSSDVCWQTFCCNTQNYWAFGLNPSSGIVETRKHNVSETASVSALRFEWLKLALSNVSNRVGVFSPPSPEDGKIQSPKRCFLDSRIPDDGQRLKTY
jgi:hypothetical protein